MAKELGFKQGAYKEAVDYFKQKINLPTKRWNSLKGAMHTRAFTIAGAMRADILLDFRNAVDKAIEKGESLQDFRNRFYQIASKWRESDPSFDEKMKKPKYGAWRSKVIYQTNMLTAAAAAQERQAREMPEVFTHAKYICMMMPTSREQHKAWNGTVLPVNDPWWEKHSPPNGFGCLCEKEFISKYEMKAGLEKETKAPTPANDTTNIGENWDYSIGDADAENQRLKEYTQEKEEKLFEKDIEIQKLAKEKNSTVAKAKIDERKDVIAGNIPELVIDEKIDSFDSPQKLFEYMENKRGFKIDEKLKKFDLDNIKGILKGIDSVMEVFPEAQIEILKKAIKPPKRERAYTGYKKIPNSPLSIGLNEKYFGKDGIPYKDTGFHPKNGSPFSTAAHEMGHVIHYKITQANYFAFYNQAENVAEQIVKKAVEDSNIPLSDDNVSKFRARISRYAETDYTETIGEAIADVFTNRSNAAKESKAIYRALMNRLKQIRKNIINN
jgi:hypothetical protein